MEALYIVYAASVIILGVAISLHMRQLTESLTQRTGGRVSPLKIDIVAVLSSLCIVLPPGLNTFFILKAAYKYCQINFFHKEL